MAIWHGSPNFGPRRPGTKVELVVLHYTAMDSAETALARLCAPEHAVSAHYLIGAEGTVWQLVRETDRAWHAGAGCWGGAGDVNSRSIGVELANPGIAPFAAAQMDALVGLLEGLLARWGLPPRAVIGHEDMAPRRKLDPGPRFDWRRLARQGVSVWPQAIAAADPDPARFSAAMGSFGYPPSADLATFRHRFRPWVGAALDGWDVAMAEDLASRLDPNRRNR
ncbi:MAG: N-acetylmuramoyl-L-alanine amidase [Pseudomonadota bacterium]